MSSLTRRDFLKFAGVSLAASFLSPNPPEEFSRGKQIGWGRVTNYSIWSYRDPHPGATQLKSYQRDDVIPIYDRVSTEGLSAHNSIWNLTRTGWVYSSWVQPVERHYNTPVTSIPASGLWTEVSMPYIPMRKEPDDQAAQLYRLYYGSVHLVVAHLLDDRGRSWYQIKDDQVPSRLEYVRAEGLRPIAPDSMTPISPEVTDKRIEVSLSDQMLYAYENNAVVFAARCATGAAFTIEGEGVADFRTAPGTYSIIRKRPSRHMLGFLGRADQYDLPGVPFCSYFTADGAAVHGAYWHNDFGHPRSHGCVNVPPDVAKWVWRWVQPSASYEDTVLEVKQGGTPVIIS
jgi:hypothetical protein